MIKKWLPVKKYYLISVTMKSTDYFGEITNHSLFDNRRQAQKVYDRLYNHITKDADQSSMLSVELKETSTK